MLLEEEKVRQQLEKILGSAVFAKSPRMSRFLRFVVETTLEGDSGRLKEYVIAVDVFDKPADYDPKTDSTVRTEATKLRSRLSRYYATDGREDPIAITIPKGSYIPSVEYRGNVAPVTAIANEPVAARDSFPWSRRLAILAVGLSVAGAFLWRSRPSSMPASRLIPITSYPELEEQPSLSPDGSQVAFRWKDDIYVKPVSAETVVQVTKDPGVESWPAWSPDGSQIAFVRGGSVFLVSPLGGPERKIAESSGRVAWIPDGSALLVLQKTSNFGAQSVFRVSIATGQKQRLTFSIDISRGDINMAMSPDGRTLAFCRAETADGCDLYLMPAAGGAPRQLTNDMKGILGFTWTADGREIVFASNRLGRFQLWRVAAHPAEIGGAYANPVLVEGAGDDARNPTISSTSKLAYQRYSRNFDIQKVEIAGQEGTATHRLGLSTQLIASTQLDAEPSWSPDGRSIAFVSNRSGSQELWVCDADGGNPVQLTSFNGPAVILPRWSPDGQRLVFAALSGPGGNFESYIVGAGGGVPRRVTAPGHRTMAHPVFSHDGWMYFIPGVRDGAVEAYRMPVKGGEAFRVTNKGAFRPEESPDGRLLFYGKYGTSGLWSTPIPGGEERQILDSITGMNWTVTADGIYYLDFAVGPAAPKLVKFYTFKTAKTNQVGTVSSTVSADYSGISVSSDGRWLLYSYIAEISSDLMMVDHFR
jgi:Tol biopolymer transport system component